LSVRPKSIGGGSNTFAGLFKKWAKKRGNKIVRNIERADLAIIIAHLADQDDLIRAKQNGCHIIHRLDEYFEENESDARRKKHSKIISLNRHADITVFQSRFVCENVYPHIEPRQYRIIHNGSDPEKFYPAKETGKYIGHVTWGIDSKKRLDLLYEFIGKHPQEQFLLIGRHKESSIDFNLPNVQWVGKVPRRKMPRYYRKMKLLYFPSEKDPCPNTVVEAILSGVPVCYNPDGGTPELVKDCGESLDSVDLLRANLQTYRERCFFRKELHFDNVFEQYLSAHRRVISDRSGVF
jgi:glycosyltransferase involved in cell wall biosynthesis